MRTALSLLALAVLTWSCGPKCETASRPPASVCHRADAGEVVAGQAFTLDVATTSFGSCVVQVDAGTISIGIESTFCDARFGASDLAAPRQGPVTCQVPALPAGTYVVTSDATTSFTIPTSLDAGLPNCL
jgi:hypothetical protein